MADERLTGLPRTKQLRILHAEKAALAVQDRLFDEAGLLMAQAQNPLIGAAVLEDAVPFIDPRAHVRFREVAQAFLGNPDDDNRNRLMTYLVRKVHAAPLFAVQEKELPASVLPTDHPESCPECGNKFTAAAQAVKMPAAPAVPAVCLICPLPV